VILEALSKLQKRDYKLRHVCLPVHPYVRVDHIGYDWTDYRKILYTIIFRKYVQKFKLHSKRTRITGTLHEDHYTFLIISRLFLLRIRKVSDKPCRDNHSTHFTFNSFFFQNRAVYDIMWQNIVEPGRPQMTIWRTFITCWTPRTTDSHSEYVIFISLPRQQLLHERVSVYRYTQIASLVNVCVTVIL